MITVCTTSPEQHWGELGEVMSLLGATASSSGMDLALTDATAWVERYILNGAGTLRRQVYVETLAGGGTQRLMLSRTPVLGVQRMFDATSTDTATEYCSTDYRLENADAGFLEVTTNAGFSWDVATDWFLTFGPRPSAVYRPWLVAYEAGWQYACTSSTSDDWVTTTTGRTLPDDIARATVLKAVEMYQGSMPGGPALIKVGPLMLQNTNYGSQSLDPILEILSRYRRVV